MLITLKESSGHIGSITQQDRLEEYIVPPLHVDKAGVGHQAQQPIDGNGIVAAREVFGLTAPIGALGSEVGAQVVLICVPLPDLYGQKPASCFMAKTIRTYVRVLALDGRVVAH